MLNIFYYILGSIIFSASGILIKKTNVNIFNQLLICNENVIGGLSSIILYNENVIGVL